MTVESERIQSWEDAVSWLISQPDQQELVKSCYYDRPALGAAQRFWNSDEWRQLRAYFPASKGTALDVGAGMGVASYALASDGWKTTALEPDASPLVGAEAIRSLAKAGGVDICVEQTWGENLPFADSCFDLIHARQVLHHAHDLKKFCSELNRVLKPGGIMVATREHVISSSKQLPQFLAGHPLHQIYGGENAFLLKEYKNALFEAGLNIETVLGPFDSAINYAPFTKESLCSELVARASKFPGGAAVAHLLLSKPLCSMTLRLLSIADSRPGRLYTFVCKKERIY